eukprot:2231412-Amphidinium_carterae.1
MRFFHLFIEKDIADNRRLRGDQPVPPASYANVLTERKNKAAAIQSLFALRRCWVCEQPGHTQRQHLRCHSNVCRHSCDIYLRCSARLTF